MPNQTTRVINGILYHCLDVGCPYPAHAAYNRVIVARGLYSRAYDDVRKYLEHTPTAALLPSWIPTGSLPQVDGKHWKESGGGQGGMSEDIVVGLTDNQSEEYNRE